ncbi:MAG: glycosyltransferase family 39 protein [Nitrospirae bacterium]|nr:glycosyltransferase family 39 protein [Nitrospirota bacterium]
MEGRIKLQNPPSSPFIKGGIYVLTALLLLLTFLLQYTFRYADDNRLTSWQWTFAHIDLMRFLPLLIIGLISAFLLSVFPFYKSRPALFLFISSFAAGAVAWSAPEVIVDSARYFTQAKHLELYGMRYFFREWGKDIFAWTDLPLVSFFYGVIFRFFGESRTYIQIFTSSMFSMTLVLTYLTGKTLWDEETGFAAGALLLGVPYLFSQTPLMLTDIPTMFFLALSIYTFCKAMEKGGAWIGGASLALFCAMFSKYSAWMMLSVLPVIFVVYFLLPSPFTGEGKGGGGLSFFTLSFFTLPLIPSRQGRGKYLYRAVSVALIAGAFVAVAAIYKSDIISQQMKFLQEYQSPGLRRWGESFVSTFLFQTHPFITLAALFSVYEAVRRRDVKFAVACWLVLLIVLFQIKRSRYIMVVFPMLTLMASYGLQRIRDAGLRRSIVFGAIASSLAVAMFSYLPFLQRNSMVNIRTAGEYLNSAAEGTICVYTVNSDDTVVNLAVSVPLLDLYTDREIYYRDDKSYSPPPEEIKTSPLRFTWELRTPPYYLPTLKRGALVIISNGRLNSLPDHIAREAKDYGRVRVFDASEGVFGFNPFVMVRLPEK